MASSVNITSTANTNTGNVGTRATGTTAASIAATAAATVATTVITRHNKLLGLQGGITGQYYHLTQLEYIELSNWIDNIVLSDDGSIETSNDIWINSNSSSLCLGANKDVSVFFDGTNLNINIDNPSDIGPRIKLNDDVDILGELTVENITGTMTLKTGSIIDSSGIIDFDNENLITTGNLTVDGNVLLGGDSFSPSIGIGLNNPSSTTGIDILVNNTGLTIGVDMDFRYFGSGISAIGFRSAVLSSSSNDNAIIDAFRAEGTQWFQDNTGGTYTTVGAKGVVKDDSSRTYIGTGSFQMYAGNFYIQNLSGNWSSNPTVTTCDIYLGLASVPTFGGNHTHWSLFSNSGNSRIRGDLQIDADNKGIIFGDGQNSSIKYNATHLVVSTRDAGVGNLYLDGAAELRMRNISSGNNGLLGYSTVPTHIFSLTRQESPGAGTTSLASFAGIGFVPGVSAPGTGYKVFISSVGNLGIGTTIPVSKFHVVDTVTTDVRGCVSSQHSTDVFSARYITRKSRGSHASPTIVLTGDVLGEMLFSAYDGSNYLQMGSILTKATGTVSLNRIPTEMQIWTATNASPSVITKRMTVTNTGNVQINSSSALLQLGISQNASIGYDGTNLNILANSVAASGIKFGLDSTAFEAYEIGTGTQKRGLYVIRVRTNNNADQQVIDITNKYNHGSTPMSNNAPAIRSDVRFGAGSPTGLISEAGGIQSRLTWNVAGSNITESWAFQALGNFGASYLGTITDAYGFHVKGFSTNVINITNLYGLKINDVIDGTNNWAIHTGKGDIRLGDETIKIGVFGALPTVRSTGWTAFTNLATDKTCDATNTSVNELADILGTLIEELKTKGLLSV